MLANRRIAPKVGSNSPRFLKTDRPVHRPSHFVVGLGPPSAEVRKIDLGGPVRYSRVVFVRLGHIFLMLALLAATGGHWSVLQTVAWTNMLAHNLRTSSIEAALIKTFDGKNPCGLCKQISAGKQSEKKTAFPTLVKKLEFVSARPVFVFTAPTDFRFLPESTSILPELALQPPVPPPRAA